jgi:8-oxo-dGTP diphosphatase
VADFTGANIALRLGDTILLYLRDNRPRLPFANMWDFPGGRREGSESPIACIVRETREEFSITLDPEAIYYQKQHPSLKSPDTITYFMAADIMPEQVRGIVLGDEGQRWEMMPSSDVLVRTDIVPHLQARFREFVTSTAQRQDK